MLRYKNLQTFKVGTKQFKIKRNVRWINVIKYTYMYVYKKDYRNVSLILKNCKVEKI